MLNHKAAQITGATVNPLIERIPDALSSKHKHDQPLPKAAAKKDTKLPAKNETLL